jgi:hypothetical protein
MMNPSPSTPPGHQNGGGTRQRQRIGSELPYRDDPVRHGIAFVSIHEEMALKMLHYSLLVPYRGGDE